ncbi:MAG: hypothetical protein ABII93_00610 [Chrysiogenia bacterium]
MSDSLIFICGQYIRIRDGKQQKSVSDSVSVRRREKKQSKANGVLF